MADEFPAGRNVDGLKKQQRTMRAVKRSRKERRYLLEIKRILRICTDINSKNTIANSQYAPQESIQIYFLLRAFGFISPVEQHMVSRFGRYILYLRTSLSPRFPDRTSRRHPTEEWRSGVRTHNIITIAVPLCAT